MVFSPAKFIRVLTSLVDRSLDGQDTAATEQQSKGRNGHQTGHDGGTADRPQRRRRTKGGHPHLAVVERTLVEREDSHGKPRSPAE